MASRTTVGTRSQPERQHSSRVVSSTRTLPFQFRFLLRPLQPIPSFTRFRSSRQRLGFLETTSWTFPSAISQPFDAQPRRIQLSSSRSYSTRRRIRSSSWNEEDPHRSSTQRARSQPSRGSFAWSSEREDVGLRFSSQLDLLQSFGQQCFDLRDDGEFLRELPTQLQSRIESRVGRRNSGAAKEADEREA